jgi:hypothetical protein
MSFCFCVPVCSGNVFTDPLPSNAYTCQNIEITDERKIIYLYSLDIRRSLSYSSPFRYVISCCTWPFSFIHSTRTGLYIVQVFSCLLYCMLLSCSAACCRRSVCFVIRKVSTYCLQYYLTPSETNCILLFSNFWDQKIFFCNGGWVKIWCRFLSLFVGWELYGYSLCVLMVPCSMKWISFVIYVFQHTFPICRKISWHNHVSLRPSVSLLITSKNWQIYINLGMTVTLLEATPYFYCDGYAHCLATGR